MHGVSGRGSVSGMTPRIEVIQGWQQQYAVWFWDAESETEAVVFYDDGLASQPLEVRMWRAQYPLTGAERKKVMDTFVEVPKLPFGDMNRRAVPLGEMHRAALQHVGSDQVFRLKHFRPPSPEEVEMLVSVGDNVIFRNRRDLEAHAQELRAVDEYLAAVIIRGSDSPTVDVAAALGLDVQQSRRIIERARTHGYLTRNSGGVGGELTELAEETAKAIRKAASHVRGKR